MSTPTVEVEEAAVAVEITGGDVSVVEATLASAPGVVEVIVPGSQGPAGPAGPPKAITIAQPRPGDEFTLFYTQRATTITQALGVVRGVDPSVTVELRYDSSRAATGTEAAASTVITSTTTGDPLSIQNMPIPADRYVWIKVLATDGVVAEVNVTVEI